MTWPPSLTGLSLLRRIYRTMTRFLHPHRWTVSVQSGERCSKANTPILTAQSFQALSCQRAWCIGRCAEGRYPWSRVSMNPKSPFALGRCAASRRGTLAGGGSALRRRARRAPTRRCRGRRGRRCSWSARRARGPRSCRRSTGRGSPPQTRPSWTSSGVWRCSLAHHVNGRPCGLRPQGFPALLPLPGTRM